MALVWCAGHCVNPSHAFAPYSCRCSIIVVVDVVVTLVILVVVDVVVILVILVVDPLGTKLRQKSLPDNQ